MSYQNELLHLLRCAIADLEGILPEHDPSGEKEHPAWKTLEELQAKVNCLETDTVLFSWCVEDVQSVRPDLSNEQAMQVLESCHDNHDADNGMNWMFIKYIADDMFPKKGD